MRLFLLFLLFTLTATAQRIQVSAPHAVETGQQFPITYTVNTQDVAHPQLSAIPAGLRLLDGPYVSQQSSFQVINGHASSSSSVQFTYIFQATRHGHVTVPAFHVTASGKKVAAQRVSMTIVGQDEQDEPQQQRSNTPAQQPSAQHNPDGTAAKGAGSDLFITVTASKKSCLEQEPVLLTYKVYTRENLKQLVGKMPDVKGAHTQEVKLPQQKSLQPDTYNGESYSSTVWTQYVVYPQTTGKLHIPAISFEGVVQQEDRSFMSMGGYTEEARTIHAPAIDIDVRPLPTKPKTFAGGVGHFTLSAQPGQTTVKAGDPFTLRIVIGGAGNLKLIQQPTVNFPTSFDVYDTKTTDKTHLTANGVEGNMVYDYTAVPRREGRVTIPAVEWTYYDTAAHQYRTLRSAPITLVVTPGSAGAADAADYTGQQKLDIRPINRQPATVRSLSDAFFGSPFYVTSLLVLAAIFIALLLRFHRRALERADVVKMRSKNASKTADKRLRRARRLMLKGRPDHFYEEVLKALWGYAANRLNMKREQLSRDNIADKFNNRNVDQETIQQFIDAIDECEYERYAPGDPAGNMNRTIEAARNAITNIEEALRNARNANRAQRSGYALTIILLLLPIAASAITKQNGDNEYQRGNYAQAVADYQTVLRNEGKSTEVYYNLGCAYYRLDNIPQAILAFERALQLSPSNSDARFNLELARTKTIDKVVAPPDLFIVTWARAVVNLASADQWAITSIIALALALTLFLAFLFVDILIVRRLSFYVTLLAVVTFALSLTCAFIQRSAVENRRGAIVTTPSVTVHKTPATTAEESFVIHEGTRVDIQDKTMKDWRQITLADGRQGWLPAKTIEEI